jgi:hypothetical protein
VWRVRGAGMEQGFVQKLVAQATVEAFDEGILGRLSGRDVTPAKLAIIHELQDRIRIKLGPVTVDAAEIAEAMTRSISTGRKTPLRAILSSCGGPLSAGANRRSFSHWKIRFAFIE